MILLREFMQGVVTRSAEETVSLGEKLALGITFNATIALYGDLGSGKTTFAKGLAEGLGVKETVKSPSYNVYSVYKANRLNFVHIDAYRLENPAQYEDLLIDEIVQDPKVLCVEWPEKIGDNLALNTLKLHFSILEDGAHFIKVL